MTDITLTREQRANIEQELRTIRSAEELQALSRALLKAFDLADIPLGECTLTTLISGLHYAANQEIRRRESEASS